MKLASEVDPTNGAGFAWSAGTPRFCGQIVGRNPIVSTPLAEICMISVDICIYHIGLMFTMANPQDERKQPKARLDDGHWLASECQLPQGV